MIDVFISYEHESKNIADNLVSVLESNNIRCWYAPRDVIGDYATSICNAIQEAKIFVVIMNSQASQSDHVLNEVEMAYFRYSKKEITIMPFKISDEELSMAMMYYLKRLHWIDSTTNGLNNAINELKDKILKNLGREDHTSTTFEIVPNKYYFDINDKKELHRLDIQAKITQRLDQDVYERALKNRNNLVCLDFGSNDGTSIARRMLNREEVSKIIGFESSKEAVDLGNSKFNGTKIKLYQKDLENFSEDYLQEILTQNDIDKIDIAVCSFILMHMKNKKSLLKVIRKYLSDDGILIIADVDDGLYMAYPDKNGMFEKAFHLLKKDKYSGNRYSGRSLYFELKKSGYKNIKLEHSGVNTTEMDYDSREATWAMNFDYLESDLEIMLKEDPTNISLQDDLRWWKENKDEMLEQVLSDDFFFMDSTIVFSCTK